VREPIPDTWVFWIHASNAARIEQGYQQIAAVAEIPGRDDPKTNILQLVYQWLCDARNGRWLMVLDNADDDSIFFSGDTSNGGGPLMSFLPQAAHGSMLITSRNGLAARNLVGTDGHVITVEPMNEEESLALLRARIPPPQSGQSEEDERSLVQALEYIPLAITQAGSYIANRSPRVTVSRYLQLFRESESNQTHLLQHEDAKDLRRDPSIRYAVITTWQLSFEQIRHERPAATELLALMSMFDRQGIPEDLVRGNGDGLQYENAVAPLISYSLVRVQIETASFDMHRLVQLSVRTWLEIHLELARWQEKSRAVMAQIFPNGEYASWTECQRLLPHVKEVMKSISDGHEEDRLHMATISSNSGWYLLLRGSYGEAEMMQRWAMHARERLLGREHPSTLTSVNNLGLVLYKQGKYEEAETTHRRALEAREKVLGREHRNTLASVSGLGNVLSDQGKYEEAEAMHRRALEGSEKVLGPEHPDTLTGVSSLGLVLSSQGKYEEAEAVHRRALQAEEKVLGREHHHTLTCVNNLGLVLESQGKYQEAEAMFRRSLGGYQEVLGHKHPHTLTSVNNLGGALFSQGKYEEAEAMHRQALETQEKVLGREHPDTLSSVSNLGGALSSQGKYEEAEVMHRRALKGREKVLGREHPDTLCSVSNLGLVLSSQEKYEEAERTHRQVLEGFEKVLGREHPHTLTSVDNLGFVLDSRGKYEEAERMYRQALKGREKVLGREHPDTLCSVSNLGGVLSSQEKYEEAERMHRRALKGSEKVLGYEHPDTLTRVDNLGSVLDSQGKYEEAEAMHRRTLEPQVKELGRDHDSIQGSVNGPRLNLSIAKANIKIRKRHIKETWKGLRRYLDIRTRSPFP
jgi:tetratricopeptide (TPR) repeat protein